MPLNYGHTCPDIDRSIEAFKSDIGSYLSNMLDDCCPLLQGEQKEDFIKDYVEQMYSDFEYNFENVRKTNEDMRKKADAQIDSAEQELQNAKDEIDELTARIGELEREVSDLESQLEAVSDF